MYASENHYNGPWPLSNYLGSMTFESRKDQNIRLFITVYLDKTLDLSFCYNGQLHGLNETNNDIFDTEKPYLRASFSHSAIS